LLSSEGAEGLHIPVAVHTVEEDNRPAAAEGHRIHLAVAGVGSLAVGRIHLAGRSLEEHQEVGQTGSDHHTRLAEGEHRIQELRPEDGSTSRPWCRMRDQLHQGSA
jgi:hypothetical protein